MADINQIDPAFRPLVSRWLFAVAAAGLYARITVTYRDAADQNQVEAEGLSNAGAGQSPHNCVDADGNPASRAIDFAIFKDGTFSDYITNGSDPRYAQAGQIAIGLGMWWGGSWTKAVDGCGPDYDHIEMANWQTA